MKLSYSTLIGFLLFFSAHHAFSQCLSTNNLTTFYASNNGQAGQQFDIVALVDIEICLMDVNLYAGLHSYQISTKAGTHVGFEGTPAAWTLIGGPIAITSNGVDVATPIPIPINLTILAGNTGAIYFTCDRGISFGGNRYTNGTGVGNLLTANADMQILEGTGKAWNFGTNYRPRSFNGTLYYDRIVVLPVELLAFGGENTGSTNLLSWSTASELNAERFIVQRSVDGSYYENIGEVEAAGNSNILLDYSFEDKQPKQGVNYYRLKQVDFNGDKNYSNVIALNQDEHVRFNLNKLYPNPTEQELNLEFYAEDELQLSVLIFDVTGKVILSMNVPAKQGMSLTKIQLSSLPAGLYRISLLDEKGMLANEKFIKR